MGKRHGTDKGDEAHSAFGLSYLDVYEKYLTPLRSAPVNVLEIGVKDAQSLRMWKEYFPKGEIYGIDIDPRCKAFEEDRLRVEIGSQDDAGFLAHCFPNVRFDVIVDDGSHVNRHIIASFEGLFYSRLKAGGLYAIEDLGCSYSKLQSEHNVMAIWPGMKYNDPSKNYDNDRKELDSFLSGLIRKLDFREGAALAVHFWSRVCIITKA